LYNIIQNLKEVNEGSFIQNLFNVFSLLKSSRRESLVPAKAGKRV